MLQALLLGLLVFIGRMDWAIGTTMLHRPIVFGALTGLIMGDLHTGIVIGGTLEIFFMGSVAIGAYLPPDVNVGGVLGTALAISLGMGAEIALTLALPTAILSSAIQTVEVATFRSVCAHLSDKYAALRKPKGVYVMHFVSGIETGIRQGLMVFAAFLVGSTRMQALIDAIPQQIISGMTIATGILPAIGIALLMRMIVNKKVIPYLVLGFALSAYLNVPIIGIAILGTILILTKFDFTRIQQGQPAAVGVNVEVDDDDF